MCDKLTFDLSQEVEGNPSVFVRKDWINILDNMTQNYTANQSVLDTSQLSNSNKYMSYRESYFLLPLTVTLASLGQGNVQTTAPVAGFLSTANIASSFENVMQPLGLYSKSLDSAVGLKNWFGNIIHSFTLDYNGSTIVQQTPFVNMWNSFKLMTSLSYNDVITQGCSIGFYPDDAEALSLNFIDVFNKFSTNTATEKVNPNPEEPNVDQIAGEYAINGNGVCNNNNAQMSNFQNDLSDHYQNYKSGLTNQGFCERSKWINYDELASMGSSNNGSLLSSVLTNANCGLLWKSYITKKQNQTIESANVTYVDGNPASDPKVNASATIGQKTPGIIQYGIVATIYLKHVHSFFNMVPLLKGVFMKMTMNLNNTACSVVCGSNIGLGNAADAGAYIFPNKYQYCTQVSSALGGTNPLLLSSVLVTSGANNLAPNVITTSVATTADNQIVSVSQAYRLSLSVGARCLDSVTNSIAGGLTSEDLQCKSLYLYIPAYTFNPTFEQAYISSPVKSIKYTDIYQYQVLGIGGNGAPGTFNNLLTNGIANIKSVLILPFFSANNDSQSALPAAGTFALGDNQYNQSVALNTGFIPGVPVWQSPFDPAGSGATSPLVHFTNFNIQVSGSNSIYNLQLRSFEQFNNQLYGQNAVNGGLTDGITSSLVDRQQFDLEYCYYYVNVERMLPVEQSVPKSIQVLGTCLSQKKVDLLCFVEYGNEVSIDILTGARV